MMAISMYQLTVPAFVRGLTVLADLLKKAEAREQHGSVPDALISARLADDMLPLSAQVQRASDTSKMSVERLTAWLRPSLKITKRPSISSSVSPIPSRICRRHAEQFDGSETRTVKLNFGGFGLHCQSYLLTLHYPTFSHRHRPRHPA
jgi:hypothetical protein